MSTTDDLSLPQDVNSWISGDYFTSPSKLSLSVHFWFPHFYKKIVIVYFRDYLQLYNPFFPYLIFDPKILILRFFFKFYLPKFPYFSTNSLIFTSKYLFNTMELFSRFTPTFFPTCPLLIASFFPIFHSLLQRRMDSLSSEGDTTWWDTGLVLHFLLFLLSWKATGKSSPSDLASLSTRWPGVLRRSQCPAWQH